MKKVILPLIAFLIGAVVGAFALGLLGHDLWQKTYEDNVANNLSDTIITASQLRSHKAEKALQDLDADILIKAHVLGQTNRKSPDAEHAWSLAQTYYKVHHTNPNPAIIAFFQSAPALSTEQLSAIEDLDRASMVAGDIQHAKAK